MQFIHAHSEQEWIYHATSYFSDCLDAHECPLITFPTGNTPAPFYQSLRHNHSLIGRDFRFLMLDEYAGLSAGDTRHFGGWLTHDLLDPLKVPMSQRHMFDPYASDFQAECTRFCHYRRDMGPLHLAFLGVGSNGHVAMNDPPADIGSQTRVITMSDKTYDANMKYWGATSTMPLPRCAYSLGMHDLFEAQKIIILIRQKPDIVDRLQNMTRPDPHFPISLFLTHPNIVVLSL